MGGEILPVDPQISARNKNSEDWAPLRSSQSNRRSLAHTRFKQKVQEDRFENMNEKGKICVYLSMLSYEPPK